MPVLRHASNVGSSTEKLTRPLIIKILGAFGVLLLLVLIVSFTAIFNSNHVAEVNQKTSNLQNRARLLQQLQLDVTQAQVSIYTPTFLFAFQTNVNTTNDIIARQLLTDPKNAATLLQTLTNFQYNFQQHYNQLTDTNYLSSSILILKNKLIASYTQTFQQLISTDPSGPTNINEATQYATQLLGNLAQDIQATNSEVANAQNEANSSQNFAATLIAILIILAVIVSGLVAWFVVRTVVRPLSALNQNLTQLLWEQTSHLTDRMNVQQYEINSNSDMLQAARHDLKAPFSSIKGLAELTTITHPDLAPEVCENLDNIIKMSDSSVEMVSNVLSRRETRLELQEVNLNSLVDRVLQLVDLREFNVAREVETDSAIFDVGLMEHALLNLVSNARKFSKGGIGVGVKRIPKAGTLSEQEVELWVWNDGTTISAGDRNEIFKPGRQTAEGKKAGGHGLGLTIVKSIVEMHHGRILVDSHEKKGTFFRMVLPDLTSIETTAVTPAQPPLAEPPAKLVAV